MNTFKKQPKKTKEGVIYSGDNGRLSCIACSGGSLSYTLRDLSGQRAVKMTPEDNAYWIQELGKPMSCECGKTLFDANGICTTDYSRPAPVYGPKH